MADKLRVDLSGAPLTMLATLYAKALDVDLAHPILSDKWAKDIVGQLDYDWSRTTVTRRTSPSVTTRSAHFDTWVRQFLAVHPRSTVLHLGCGLDSRYLRIGPGPDVEWYDVDYPAVAALRTQLFDEREHYHVVASSITEPGYLADMPADRPTLVIGEGVTMYLTRADGIALFRRVLDRFPSGELQFDSFNSLGIKTQWSNRIVTRAGATLHWGIDKPSDILTAVPGTRLLAWISVFDSEAFRAIPGPYRLMGTAMSTVPALRYMAQYHRYAFGPPS
jgi:O-methyltransferase involved in polyketide biosynthesis